MVSSKSLAVSVAAKAIYESKLRGELEASHLHEFVAIEPESGQHFLGKTLTAAIQSARAAYPERISFALRIGHPAAVHLGAISR